MKCIIKQQRSDVCLVDQPHCLIVVIATECKELPQQRLLLSIGVDAQVLPNSVAVMNIKQSC